MTPSVCVSDWMRVDRPLLNFVNTCQFQSRNPQRGCLLFSHMPQLVQWQPQEVLKNEDDELQLQRAKQAMQCRFVRLPPNEGIWKWGIPVYPPNCHLNGENHDSLTKQTITAEINMFLPPKNQTNLTKCQDRPIFLFRLGIMPFRGLGTSWLTSWSERHPATIFPPG